MRHWTAERLRSQKGSIFDQINVLARQCGAVNLGSGTPDLPVPEPLQTALREAVAAGHNRYAPVEGEAVLREAVAVHASRFYGQKNDPAAEVSITNGVTEAVFAAVFSCIDPGDEVIVFEPCYDSYVPSIRTAGGIPVAVTMHAPSFRFDPQELRTAFSGRTKALVLNSPHNPTGTVFSRSELALIAKLCQEHDVLAITDEVYEHVVYDGGQNVRLATLPGMWERTLTLSGAGKTFSCPGWRIGWAIGPAPLQETLSRLRQFTVFAAPTPFQFAVAAGLAFPDSYFHHFAAGYREHRDFLFEALAACALKPSKPAGSYFILTDISAFPFDDGREFCSEMARNLGVVAVPMDTFYLHPQYGKRMVRFAFSLRRESLDTAVHRLKRLPALVHRVQAAAREVSSC